MPSISPLLPLALVLGGFSAGLHAAPRHQDVTGPGGFMSACAAPTSSGAPRTPGVSMINDFTTGGCQVTYFTGNGSTSAAYSYSGGHISNSSSGAVGIGHIHLAASNLSRANDFFATGAASGGFEDRLTLTLPGRTGQTVHMLVAMSIDGTLNTVGGSANMQVTAYKNTDELMASTPGYQPNGAGGGTDRQRVSWGQSRYLPPKVIDANWVFSVPVVVGTAFDFGVYARALAGQASVTTGATYMVSGSLDFSNSVLVQGVSGLLVGGELVTQGYDITAASGLDWTQPLPVPEPASALMLAAGLALVGAWRLRSQRRA